MSLQDEAWEQTLDGDPDAWSPVERAVSYLAWLARQREERVADALAVKAAVDNDDLLRPEDGPYGAGRENAIYNSAIRDLRAIKATP